MKHASSNYRNRSGAWKGKALATLLAVSLAAAPMAAFASDSESAAAEEQVAAEDTVAADAIAEEQVAADAGAEDAAAAAAAVAEAEAAVPAPQEQLEVSDHAAEPAASEVTGEATAEATSEEASELASEKQPKTADGDESLTTSVTVYYCEMVHYDDPSFSDPTGFRLLGSHTFDGVKVGEEIDLWEYAKDIPDFVHFDGWAVNPVASANPEENLVQMNYFRTKSPSEVNYYLVTDGGEASEDAPIDPSMGQVNGEPVAFWKMGSYEVESLRLGTEISSAACAVPLEGLMYLDADRDAITVDAVPSHNEINLFYAAVPVDQPDAAPSPAPDADKPAEDTNDGAMTPGDGSEDVPGNGSPSAPEVDGSVSPGSGSEGGTDSGAVKDEADAEQDGTTVVTDENAPDASDSSESDSDAAFQEASERGVLELPQTSDGTVALAGAAAVAAVVAVTALAAARRRNE